jgi:hypothetical protein
MGPPSGEGGGGIIQSWLALRVARLRHASCILHVLCQLTRLTPLPQFVASLPIFVTFSHKEDDDDDFLRAADLEYQKLSQVPNSGATFCHFAPLYVRC